MNEIINTIVLLVNEKRYTDQHNLFNFVIPYNYS